MMELEILGVGLLLAGITLLIAVILILASKTEKRNVEGGAVIIIGPIPILVASNRKIAILLIAITLILIIVMYIWAWTWIRYT